MKRLTLNEVKENIDRVIIRYLSCYSKQMIYLLTTDIRQNTLFPPKIDCYQFPDYLYIFPIEECLNNNLLEYINPIYEYAIFNAVSKEIFCMNSTVKEFFESVRNPLNTDSIYNMFEDSPEKVDIFINSLVNSMLLYYNQANSDTQKKVNKGVPLILNYYKSIKIINETNIKTSVLIEDQNKVKLLIKYLKTDKKNSSFEIFENEIKLLKKLNLSQFTPKILDNDKNWALIEYIEGIDLDKFLVDRELSVSQKYR